MHPDSHFRESDPLALADLVAARGLAFIVGVDAERPITTAAPVLLSCDRLRFHLSSRNRLTPILTSSSWALAIVPADDAYVIPDWYAAADQVPTWNYRSVEIEGSLRVMERGELATLLDDLSAHFEQALAPKPPWTRTKMRSGAFEAMLGAITGFEMTIERLEGTFKLSQNKPAAEAEQVAARLAELPDAGAQAISASMTARKEKVPPSTDASTPPPPDRASAPTR